MPGCNIIVPQKILQIAATDDTFVPYEPGEKGKESPAATVQVADAARGRRVHVEVGHRRPRGT